MKRLKIIGSGRLKLHTKANNIMKGMLPAPVMQNGAPEFMQKFVSVVVDELEKVVSVLIPVCSRMP
jgi:hypothetical protein